MTRNSMGLSEKIAEAYPDEKIQLANGFDEAFLGVTSDFVAAYSVTECIKILSKEMVELDAIDFFYSNVECAFKGDKPPIWIHKTFGL